MKILKLLAGLNLLLCFATTGVSAQTISPFGMSITGTTITDGKIFVSYTLGEVFSGAINGEGTAVIGILQPEKVLITSYADTRQNNSVVNFFPNPATDVLNISDPEGKVNNLVICNIYGEPVLSSQMTGTVNLETISAGMYNVQLFDKSSVCFYSFKISKL